MAEKCLNICRNSQLCFLPKRHKFFELQKYMFLNTVVQNMKFILGVKELKINPESPFSPTKKPIKSAIKPRPSASDFF